MKDSLHDVCVDRVSVGKCACDPTSVRHERLGKRQFIPFVMPHDEPKKITTELQIPQNRLVCTVLCPITSSQRISGTLYIKSGTAAAACYHK